MAEILHLEAERKVKDNFSSVVERTKNDILQIMGFANQLRSGATNQVKFLENLDRKCLELIYYIDSHSIPNIESINIDETSQEFVEVKDLFEDITVLVKRNSSKARTRKIFITSSGKVPEIKIDRNYFSQAIEKIITNIVEGMEENKVLVVRLAKNSDNSLSIFFVFNTMNIKQVELIHNNENIQNILKFFDIKSSFEQIDSENRITFIVPGERVR